MNMFAQTKTILTPTYLRERMAPPAPVKLDLRHGVILYLEDISVSFDGFAGNELCLCHTPAGADGLLRRTGAALCPATELVLD